MSKKEKGNKHERNNIVGSVGWIEAMDLLRIGRQKDLVQAVE